MKEIVGVDLCEINGISEVSCVELISEIGVDMSKWKNNKHFSAWLNLCPNTKITGNKIISSRMQKRKNLAGQTLRMAASSLYASKSPLGDYSRKMRSRLGKKGGVVATAHQIAKIIYVMIKEQKPFNSQLMAKEQSKWKARRISYLEKQLNYLRLTA